MSLSEHKQWAREFYKGVENSLKASFSPDFSELDEDGIKADVEQSRNQGFFSSMCSPTGVTLEERKKFIEIVCREARPHMLVGANVNQPNIEDAIELLVHAEKAGCTHAFVGSPRKMNDPSEASLFAYFAKISESTKLPIILYGYDSPALRHLHPSGILVDVLDRVADLPNVIGMKLTQPINVGLAYELLDRLSGKLLFGPANVQLIPLLARAYNIQWSGQWIVEALQSPERPYFVEFMDLVSSGKIAAAMRPFWAMMPAYNYVHALQEEHLLVGSHPWAHINYYRWCTGGNGGLPRPGKNQLSHSAILDANGRAQIRARYQEIGVPLVAVNEDEFVVGRTNYRKGIRPTDLSTTPFFSFQ
jgi:4-hydroxy-tetrahydrodipicolinate synthase